MKTCKTRLMYRRVELMVAITLPKRVAYLVCCMPLNPGVERWASLAWAMAERIGRRNKLVEITVKKRSINMTMRDIKPSRIIPHGSWKT